MRWSGLIVLMVALVACSDSDDAPSNALEDCPEGTLERGEGCVVPTTIKVGPEQIGPARVGAAFVATFVAVGGEAPHTFSASDGLPDGLSLDADGTLSGTPDASGDFGFEVVAEDSEGNKGAAEVLLTVLVAIDDPCAAPEICDGVDNDCDGDIDEGVLNACGECGPVPAEVCGDGIDNNCNDAIDEDCEPDCVPEPEVCDGVDNDCDMEIDEDGVCESGSNIGITLGEVFQVDPQSFEVSIAYTLENSGPGGAAAFIDRLYLTDPDVPTAVVQRLDPVEEAEMGPREVRDVLTVAELTEDITSGVWLVVVVVDQDLALDDPDRINNLLRVPFLYLKPGGDCVPGPNAACPGSDLRDVDLSDLDLTRSDFVGSDLRRADLQDADLSGANLELAVLRGAQLRDTIFVGANLDGADLRGANLREADLTDAFAREANFEGAGLRGANLTNASLQGALMSTASVRDVIWRNTICPDRTNSDANGGTCEGHLSP